MVLLHGRHRPLQCDRRPQSDAAVDRLLERVGDEDALRLPSFCSVGARNRRTGIAARSRISNVLRVIRAGSRAPRLGCDGPPPAA
jgi:hypothetical protein